MIEINKLIDDYYNWLRSRTEIDSNRANGWTRISTPFDGLFNDPIEIYAKYDNGSSKFILCDDGVTSRNLDLAGIGIVYLREANGVFQKISRNYGVGFQDKELFIDATERDFPQAFHNLISAILEMNKEIVK